MTLVSADTESGGISLDCSLLSVCFSLLNGKLEPIHTLNLKVKPDPDADGRVAYKIQAEALAVNGINLIEHDKAAITYKESKPIIYNWLKEMHDSYGSLTFFGNNIQRDIDLITNYTISENSWNNFCDRRVIDTSVIGKFLQLAGKIPEDQSLSLSKITKYYGVDVSKYGVHTSDGDVLLGIELIKNYLKEISQTN